MQLKTLYTSNGRCQKFLNVRKWKGCATLVYIYVCRQNVGLFDICKELCHFLRDKWEERSIKCNKLWAKESLYMFWSHARWVLVNTAWWVLGCGWRNDLQVWRVAVNKLNKQPWTNDKGWSLMTVAREL
jgi:hypothetical protein